MRFSQKEKKDLLLAGVLISLAFAILLSGGYNSFLSPQALLLTFPLAFLTAGLGFLLHELSHKFVAQSYKLFAEFRAYYNGLFLAVAFSFFGFIFAAPGAVYIHNYGYRISNEKNGKISLAGPLTNVVLAVVFLLILFIFPKPQILSSLSLFGLTINSLLASFNLIPVSPFDGAKILVWSKRVYGGILVISIGLFLTSFLI